MMKSTGHSIRPTQYLLLTLFAVACQPGNSADSIPIERRDSSGVEIVAIADFDPNGIRHWEVSAEPELLIGVVDGAEEYQFSGISSVVTIGDSLIAVADRSSSVRFYDPSGEFLYRVGNDGEGPGEFRYIWPLYLYDDTTLAAWDPQLMRTTTISIAGEVLGTTPGPDLIGFYSFAGAFDDGRLLGVHSGVFTFENATEGIHADPAVHFVYHPLAQTVDTVGLLQTSEAYVDMSGDRFSVRTMPFGYRASYEAADGVFFYGYSRSYEIKTFDTDGQLLRILRLARPNRPLTPAMIDDMVERTTGRIENDQARRETERVFGEIPYHETLPAYSTIALDAEGNLWVADYVSSGSPTDWTIFSPAGNPLATAQTPDRFSIREFTSDRLVGVYRDDLDVEHVAVYGLLKGE